MQNDYNPPKSLETPLQEKGFGLFAERTVYIDCMKVFYAHFSCIANLLFIYGLDPDKLMTWIELEYKNSLLNIYQKRIFNRPKKRIVMRNILYVLKDKLLFDIECDGTTVICFTRQNSKEAKRLAEIFANKFTKKREKEKSYISILTRCGPELRLIELENKKPKLSLSDDYNDEVEPFFNRTLKRLQKHNDGGILLLKGDPGTGKTNFLAYLIHYLKKRVIYLPPSIAGNLDAPELTSFLLDNCTNSIILIEDAEKILISRDTANNYFSNSVSTILNLGDGLLGKAIGINLVFTFNTEDTSRLDRALLRPGRLIELFDFKPLSIEKSRKMLERLGVTDFTVTQPMTLAEIYAKKNNGFEYNGINRKQLGFKNGT